MNYSESPYFNPVRYTCNDGSIPPMHPRPSRNPLVRFLDWLCHRISGWGISPFRILLTTAFLLCFIYPLGVAVYVGFFADDWIQWIGKPLPVIMFGMNPIEFALVILLPLRILSPDGIYRYFRNSYLDRHLLPGPYGWGSIDNDPS